MERNVFLGPEPKKYKTGLTFLPKFNRLNMSQSPFKHPFWVSFTGIGPTLKSKDEKLIMQIGKSILNKPNWQTKYQDEIIKQKWIAEIRTLIDGKSEFIEKVIEFVFSELEWIDETEKEYSVSITFDSMVIFTDLKDQFSDKFEKLSLERTDLQSQSLALQQDFGKELDFHPGSNNTVVDLVHPSLFPLQYGRTVVVANNQPYVLEYSKELSEVKKMVRSFGISETYQWLPSLFVLKDGKYKVDSYINNLDPLKYQKLYGTIESVFDSAIPQLNYVLSRYALKEYIRIPIDGTNEAYDKKYEIEVNEIYEKSDDDDFDWDVTEIAIEELKKKYIKSYLPEFSAPVTDKVIDLKSEFAELKVIVKLANIELSPENPEYSGGSWHVEGTINEDIIATILYYYDVKNITESKISFRTGYEEPYYEQGDSFYCEKLFGLHDEDSLVGELGSIVCQENRLIIFPNFYQHKVELFKLKDVSKPGHRKILCFFLVDPHNTKVLSTKDVPPQQEEWWKSGIVENLLPDEKLRELILKLQKLQDITEAKSVREKLMSERAIQVKEGLEHEEWEFSLCEH